MRLVHLASAALVLLAACGAGTPTELGMQVTVIPAGTTPQGPFDRAEIHEAWVEGDLLHLRVSYGGGCAEHDFALRFNRHFLESDPVQAPLYLAHDAKADPCRALIGRQLVFDLTPLKETYREAYRRSGGTIDLRVHAPGEAQSFPGLIRYVF
jgi:hypothetical protein